jgi:ring-1,2-phenylacetyl-CoA epoxidase subunit PaaD
VSARDAVAAVVDPEIRVVTIEELGILRDVSEEPGGPVRVTITPTYSGCPAMDVIRSDIRRALADAGYPEAEVVTQLRPAWSTDMISESGRRALAAAGIAPPAPAGPVLVPLASGKGSTSGPLAGPPDRTQAVRCPRCGSADTEELSRFGSTACKSLWRCRACTEPFDRVKPL